MQASSRVADFLSRIVIFTLVGAALVAVFVWYFPLIKKNQLLRKKIAGQDGQIQELQVQIASLTRQLELFYGDSNTVERLTRENLGYGRKGEYIFRFESKKDASPPPVAH